jgi:hypothetical protein
VDLPKFLTNHLYHKTGCPPSGVGRGVDKIRESKRAEVTHHLSKSNPLPDSPCKSILADIGKLLMAPYLNMRKRAVGCEKCGCRRSCVCIRIRVTVEVGSSIIVSRFIFLSGLLLVALRLR